MADTEQDIHEVLPYSGLGEEAYASLAEQIFGIAAANGCAVERLYDQNDDSGHCTYKFTGANGSWATIEQGLSELKTERGQAAIELIL